MPTSSRRAASWARQDDSLVALQNGCICCTLKMDLVQQLHDIIAMQKFDYIVIEASGICEPEPIAQTICSMARMAPEVTKNGVPSLDCIVTVVDALRMKDEFDCPAEYAAPGSRQRHRRGGHREPRHPAD